MSTAVWVFVPVSRTKAIGSAPMFFAGGGGQSWLVGKSPSIALSPFVHTSPSFVPPAHLPALQIGHGWRSVRQVLPGQSASVMHPWLAFVPPTQLPVWHAPDNGQSASEQHTVLAASGAEHRPKSLLQVPPGQAAAFPLTLQAPPVVQSPPALVPPTHRLGIRSPVRKSLDESGRLRPVVVPVLQFADPDASAESTLMTQVLVADPPCELFGTGSGGPKRHPAAVHCRNEHEPPGQSALVVQELWWFVPPEQRLPPAWVGELPETVSALPLQETLATDDPWSGTFDGSGTATDEPPKYSPPQVSVSVFAVESLSRCPQVPEPIPVVNLVLVGVPPAHVHVGRVVVVVVGTVVVVVASVVVVVATVVVVLPAMVVVVVGLVVVVVARVVVVVTVVVVRGNVVLVVPPPHPPAGHASQQLGCVPTHALPPDGAVHPLAPFVTLHVVAPLAAV